jgi:hypothetical protein
MQPRWLNLPLPRDIRRLIGTYLNSLDHMMVRHAHGAMFACQCRGGCTGSCSLHVRSHVCADIAEYCDSLREHNPVNSVKCEYELFKILCAKYGSVELMYSVIAKYPDLTSIHSCGHAIYATAVYYGQLKFIEALESDKFYKRSDGFHWNEFTALEYVSLNTTVGVYKYLRERRAILKPAVYDRACAIGNIALAEYIAGDFNKCSCGKSTQGYSHCGDPNCYNVFRICGSYYSRPAPWGPDTYREIFRLGNFAAADMLWKTYQASDAEIFWCFGLIGSECFTAARIRGIIDWSEYRYDLAKCTNLAILYQYAAGSEIIDKNGDFLADHAPDIDLIKYLLAKKIPVHDFVLYDFASGNIEVYQILRGHITNPMRFVLTTIRNGAMDIFRDCVRDFDIPVNRELMNAIWRAEEYELFGEMILKYPPAKRVVEIITQKNNFSVRGGEKSE